MKHRQRWINFGAEAIKQLYCDKIPLKIKEQDKKIKNKEKDSAAIM